MQHPGAGAAGEVNVVHAAERRSGKEFPLAKAQRRKEVSYRAKPLNDQKLPQELNLKLMQKPAAQSDPFASLRLCEGHRSE